MTSHVEFSAVTTKAIYNVRQNHDGIYIVTKIYTLPGTRQDTKLGHMFLSAPFLAVTSSWGIFPYNEFMCLPKLDEPEKKVLPENVPAFNRILVPHTSSVQALFLHEATAFEFIESTNNDIRNHYCMSCAKAVLRTIDKDDPVIRVSHDEKIGFKKEFFKE